MCRSIEQKTGTDRPSAATITFFIIASGPHVQIASNGSVARRRSATTVTNPFVPSDPSSVATSTRAPIARNRSLNKSSEDWVAPRATVTEFPGRPGPFRGGREGRRSGAAAHDQDLLRRGVQVIPVRSADPDRVPRTD